MATILITGATSGLGRAVAEALGRDGHTVLVHGRDQGRIDAAVAALGGEARGYQADLAALADVRRLASEIDGVDVLINNAGVVTSERRESQDGIELTFAVNHLSHWLLTGLLGDRVRDRIVNVASIGQAPIDWGDPLLEHDWEPYRAYAQSKLAQIMFTFDLDERGVTTNAVHPATLMDTRMVRESFGRSMSTVDDGVGPVVRLATDPGQDGVSGRFFDQTREARADSQAYDPAARAELWRLSADLCGQDPYA